MDEMFLFKKSAIQGEIAEPLCADYKTEWRSCGDNKLKLVALSLRQQAIPFFVTHCYRRKGLTKEFIKKEFGDYINGYTVHDADMVKGYTYGVYVDYDYDNDLVVDKDVISVMWTVGSTIVVPKTSAPVIYISNRSNVHLVCEGFNSVLVYLFDRSRLTLEDVDEESSVTVFKYSDKADVNIGKFCLSKKVKVFDKELKL